MANDNRAFYLSGKLQWLIIIALLAALYHHVLWTWGQDLWLDDNYSHGLLIPFISLYFLKLRWPRFRRARADTDILGLFVILFGLALFLLGSVGGEQFSKRVSLVVVLYGLVAFLEGRAAARALSFPILILFFAIPLPYILYNAVAFPLKLLATKIAVSMLNLVGIPVFREGNIVHLTYTTLEVVEACSGIRSLMTLVTLAFFLGCMMHRGFFRRLLVMLLAIPVAVLANALRVTLTAILCGYNPAWSKGTLHELTGAAVFVVSFVVLWGVSWLIKSRRPAPAMVAEEDFSNVDSHSQSSPSSWSFFLAAALLGLTLFYINVLGTVTPVKPLRPLADFPRRIDGYQMVSDQTMSEPALKILGVDHYIFRDYEKPDDYNLGLYVGFYESQTEGELIHSPKHCLPGSGWNLISSEIIELKDFPVKGRTARINRLLLQKGKSKMLVHYWYHSRGRVLANEYVDRAYMIFDSLVRRRSDGALVRITGSGNDYPHAVQEQMHFARQILELLDNYLPR